MHEQRGGSCYGVPAVKPVWRQSAERAPATAQPLNAVGLEDDMRMQSTWTRPEREQQHAGKRESGRSSPERTPRVVGEGTRSGICECGWRELEAARRCGGKHARLAVIVDRV
ncbi:hypothetical protein K438DRAFT_1752441 [Mycena galopus ATCC 62051]|nr:hypothetical protein K438DRAFT_1752441 [Mycena galopus ATCC 62051]